MSKMNIAVFFGSRSCEHDVSIVSALQCMEATKAAGFEVTPVYISRDGLWYTGAPLENIETFREFNPMTKGITRVTLDVTANAGRSVGMAAAARGAVCQSARPALPHRLRDSRVPRLAWRRRHDSGPAGNGEYSVCVLRRACSPSALIRSR